MDKKVTNISGMVKRHTMSWQEKVKRMTVTNEQVAAIEAAEPIFLNLVWHQQSHIWVAEPNGGKTTLATYAAAEMSDNGLTVLYFNLDASGPDIKHYQEHAARHSYALIAPMADGTSDEDAVEVLEALQEADDLSDHVVFLDTLKKFTDVISKAGAKAFYSKLRNLTRKGLTIVSLAHSNKYLGENGELIPEGTGDLKSDCDNMSLLYSVEDPITLIQTVSTKSRASDGGKMRARLVDITFQIDTDRQVTVSKDYVDTKSEAAQAKQEAADQPLIDIAKQCLKDTMLNQTEFMAAFKEASQAGNKTFYRIAKAYAGKHWKRERRFQDNMWNYFLNDSAP